MKNLNIKTIDFPEDRYYKRITAKNQITLHHTVSGRGASGDMNWWAQNPQRIATSFVIDWTGKIIQLFSSTYWAHHLGVSSSVFSEFDLPSHNTWLNQQAIGIELDAWGGLVRSETDLKWYPAKYENGKYIPNTRMDYLTEDRIVYYPNGYRGFFAFERYTDAQIESLKNLLLYLTEHHGIPRDYNSDMWFISKDALNGKPGIWSHTSYRHDKSDAHPQYELKEMLMTLNYTK